MNAEIKTFEDLKLATVLCLKQNKRNKENFYLRIKRKTDASKQVKKGKTKNKRNKKDGKKKSSTNKNAKKQKKKKEEKKNVNNKGSKVVKCKNNPKKSKNKIRNKRAGPDPECSDTDEVGSLGSPLAGPLEQGYIW